ncbi:MAG: YciK family oxidoreductase [Gammaproteobacteria bacterium]|nr:MAG: YciK family oxidoreductase [Gammaproteobacteria bacterium]
MSEAAQIDKNILKDRIILVTGASRGIGRAVALACAQHGATVILHGRDEAKLNDVYDQIEDAGLPQPALAPLDLKTADQMACDHLANVIGEEFGKLDGVVHNAAILGTMSPIELYETNIWHEVIQVNVNSVFMLTKSLMPLLKASNDGRILLTSSGVGRIGRAYWGAYAVSKFAIEGLTQVLAGEIDEYGMAAIAVNPGATRTTMRASAFPGENPATLPTPEAIAPAYVYLLGPDGQKYNGQSLDARRLVGLS